MVGGALKLIFGWAQQKVSSTTLISNIVYHYTEKVIGLRGKYKFFKNFFESI